MNQTKIGFGKVDITPRVGVELSGFGAYILRQSVGVRDRLWARAMAVEQAGRCVVLAGCDLIGIRRPLTERVRRIVRDRAGLPAENVMVHCTHTHSGPNTAGYAGWGAPDEPYEELVPQRIAAACLEALENRREAELSHAEVPCEGIGRNRQYDDTAPLEAALREDWRPGKPELTDTTCHVLRAESGGRMTGFLSYFGCHPVVCCEQTHYIHGDYCGVATNLLERENPGAIGFFLQGANGDVNSCVAHQSETDSLRALDIIAARYARAVRRGLAEARPVAVESLAARSRQMAFSRKPHGPEKLRLLLTEQEKILNAANASDGDRAFRLATVFATSLRRMIAAQERGDSLQPLVEVQGFRLGPILLLASPFETFQAIKNDVRERAGAPVTLVMSATNDTRGYAPDRTTAAKGGYAVDTVPMITGDLPYAAIHDELVRELLALAGELG